MDRIYEFQWVLSVLESCENRKQVNSSVRLFEQFLNKWNHDMCEDIRNNYENKFENLQKEQICKIISGKNG